jgi:DNA-binding transcriptional LysR family regulator
MARSDLADLTAFVAIADHIGFRAAALRRDGAPSALGHSMR